MSWTVENKRFRFVVKRDVNLPGWAAYLAGSAEDGTAQVLLNLDCCLWADAEGDADWKHIVTESLVHELLHVFEDILGMEFNDERIERSLVEAREQIAANKKKTLWSKIKYALIAIVTVACMVAAVLLLTNCT